MMSNERGIKIMQDEGYARPIESENKLQKTEIGRASCRERV